MLHFSLTALTWAFLSGGHCAFLRHRTRPERNSHTVSARDDWLVFLHALLVHDIMHVSRRHTFRCNVDTINPEPGEFRIAENL